MLAIMRRATLSEDTWERPGADHESVTNLLRQRSDTNIDEIAS